MAIATLTIDIVAKLANLQTSFDKAAQLSERNAKRMESAFKAAGTALKAAFAGVGVQQLIAAFNASADGLAKFKDVAEQTGIAVEELSKLEPVARGAGLAIDQVAEISQKLSRALTTVDNDTRGAGKALAQLGVDLDAFRNLSAADQLQALAKALNQFADDGNKVAIVQGVLGRTGAQYLSFLKDLAEAGELNATVTAQQAAAADAYNKQISAAQLSIQRFGRAVVSDALPPLLDLFEAIRGGNDEMQRLNRGGSALRTIFEALIVFGANVKFVFEGIGREIGAIAAQIAALARLDFGAFAAISDAVKEDGRIARAELDAFEARILSAGARAREALSTADSRPTVGAFTATADAAGKAARSVRELNREINDYANSLTRERASLADWLGVREIREAEDSFRAVQQQIERINELTGRGAANKMVEDLALIDDAFFSGKISVEEYENALRRVAGITDDVTAATEKTKSIADELGFTFASAFEDAIVNGGDLRDILRSLEQDILRIITRQLVTKPLADLIGGFASSGLGGIFGGGKASGGPVMGGTPYLVGERGPEIFVPSQSGQIIPNNRAGRSTVINVNVPAGTSGATAQQIAASVARTLAIADARLN
jgi:hypothetical protein